MWKQFFGWERRLPEVLTDKLTIKAGLQGWIWEFYPHFIQSQSKKVSQNVKLCTVDGKFSFPRHKTEETKTIWGAICQFHTTIMDKGEAVCCPFKEQLPTVSLPQRQIWSHSLACYSVRQWSHNEWMALVVLRWIFSCLWKWESLICNKRLQYCLVRKRNAVWKKFN